MKNNYGRILILVASLLLLLTAFAVKILQIQKNKKALIKSELTESELNKIHANILNILVLGSDSVIPRNLKSWRGRSDLMLLLSIEENTKKASLISIPRDTRIELKKYKTNKINSANAIGGPMLSKKAVQKLLDIKIQHVLVFNIAGFKELMDCFGPIRIYVPKKMSYHDQKADLHIEIEPGLQEMNSETMINFLRFRSDNLGDIGRIKRQHIFFRAALRKLTDPQVLFKLPTILHKANKVFLTDMSFQEMFNLGILLRSLASRNFKSYIVPGDFGKDGSWIADELALRGMMNEIMAITEEDKMKILEDELNKKNENQ